MVPDSDAFVVTLQYACIFFHARGDVFAHLGPKPIMETARRMFRLAADMKTWDGRIEALRVEISPIGKRVLYHRKNARLPFLPDHPRIALMACKPDAMKLAPERDNRAVYERRRLGQAFKLFSEPIGMARQKCIRILDLPPVRERENGCALRMTDF